MAPTPRDVFLSSTRWRIAIAAFSSVEAPAPSAALNAGMCCAVAGHWELALRLIQGSEVSTVRDVASCVALALMLQAKCPLEKDATTLIADRATINPAVALSFAQMIVPEYVAERTSQPAPLLTDSSGSTGGYSHLLPVTRLRQQLQQSNGAQGVIGQVVSLGSTMDARERNLLLQAVRDTAIVRYLPPRMQLPFTVLPHEKHEDSVSRNMHLTALSRRAAAEAALGLAHAAWLSGGGAAPSDGKKTVQQLLSIRASYLDAFHSEWSPEAMVSWAQLCASNGEWRAALEPLMQAARHRTCGNAHDRATLLLPCADSILARHAAQTPHVLMIRRAIGAVAAAGAERPADVRGGIDAAHYEDIRANGARVILEHRSQ